MCRVLRVSIGSALACGLGLALGLRRPACFTFAAFAGLALALGSAPHPRSGLPGTRQHYVSTCWQATLKSEKKLGCRAATTVRKLRCAHICFA